MINTEGKLGMGITVEVRAADMRHWPPEHIYRFFSGIATAIRAASTRKSTEPGATVIGQTLKNS